MSCAKLSTASHRRRDTWFSQQQQQQQQIIIIIIIFNVAINTTVYCQFSASEIALQRSWESRQLMGNNVAAICRELNEIFISRDANPGYHPEGFIHCNHGRVYRETAGGVVENTKCALYIKKKCFKLHYPVKSPEAGHETQKQMTSNACAL